MNDAWCFLLCAHTLAFVVAKIMIHEVRDLSPLSLSVDLWSCPGERLTDSEVGPEVHLTTLVDMYNNKKGRAHSSPQSSDWHHSRIGIKRDRKVTSSMMQNKLFCRLTTILLRRSSFYQQQLALIGIQSSTSYSTPTLRKMTRSPSFHLYYQSHFCPQYIQNNAVARFYAASSGLKKDKDTETKTKESAIYLHVGPSGDCWTGHSIFAAKHLQPDYVKSMKLDLNMNIPHLLELLEDHPEWAFEVYDKQTFPKELIQALKNGHDDKVDEWKNGDRDAQSKLCTSSSRIR